MKLAEPQFEGQTKTKLGNTEAKSFVQKVVNDRLGEWLEKNPAEGRDIVRKGIAAATARIGRSQGARPGPQPQGSARGWRTARQAVGLPVDQSRGVRDLHRRGKLRGRIGQGRPRPAGAGDPADPRQDPQRREGPDRPGAAEHRGPGDHLRARHGVQEEFDIDKLRYHKIVLMADADVDGQHISTLLLTLLFRFMRPLIDAGHVYLAQPPLFRIRWSNSAARAGVLRP